jgi:hypothetical protein
LLLAAVAGSTPWLRGGVNLDFRLVLLILVLFGWWNCGSAFASPGGGGRHLALSRGSSTASSWAASSKRFIRRLDLRMDIL